MGEKDVAEKRLLTYADVFANIMNVGLFQGDEIIRPEELTTVLPQSTYKAEGKLRSQERDIAKLWKDSELRLALLGLENQSAVDSVMPIRIMGYDGAAYREELNAKQRKLYPVVTVVLYFGWEKRWEKPLRLKECFRIPERLEPYVSDYHINVVEVAWLPDDVIAKFSNPFRMVAEYFSQMRKKEKYHPSKESVRHAKEMLDLMALLTQDVRFKEAGENVREGESMTMRSIMLDQLEDEAREKGMAEGREKGMAEGRVKGRAEGEARTWVASVRNLMKSMKLTAQQAVEAVSVPMELREKVMEQL